MAELKVGIIGYGFIAKVHIANIVRFPGIKITSVFSRTKKSLKDDSFYTNYKKVIKSLKEVSFYTDYKEMIKKEQLDTVFIATPTQTHKEIACYCAEQGLDIFLEKPMARTLEECNSIIDSIKENKIKLFVGHTLRFWPTYGSVKNYLTSESTIGDVQSINSKRLSSFPWSRWFADQSISGGVILDLSIHDIDYALWILGKVSSVSCRATKILKYDMEVFGESLTTLNFENDKIAECEGSWAKPADFKYYTNTQIRGSKGKIELDADRIHNNELLRIQNIYSSDNGYYNQLEHFFEVILNKNKKFLVTPNEAREAVKTCLGAIKSAENEGKKIFLDELE